MQVILLDKVVNLGNLGEIVKVKDGYARNFLIPQGRARRATEANKAEFEAKRVELEKAAAAKLVEIAGAGRKARRHHRQADPEGRRRRPPVRLGHQLRHRRRAQQARLQGRQGPGAHAQWPDQDRWRQHASAWRCTPTWWSTSTSPCWARQLKATPSENKADGGLVLRAALSGGFSFLAAGSRASAVLSTGNPRLIHRLMQ